MMRVFLSVVAACSMSIAAPLAAQSNRNPDFHLSCGLGTKRVQITTEGGLLVYRYGTPRRTELQIVENRRTPNVFYRYDLLGVKGAGRQLRFTNGPYSYGIRSWFVAGPAGDEGVAFFLLKDGKLVKSRSCSRKGYEWFTEDNRLKRLERDQLWVSAEGVKTGKVPGVTPFEPRH